MYFTLGADKQNVVTVSLSNRDGRRNGRFWAQNRILRRALDASFGCDIGVDCSLLKLAPILKCTPPDRRVDNRVKIGYNLQCRKSSTSVHVYNGFIVL